MYKRLEEVNQGLNNLRENGLSKGKSVGFNWDDLPYTVKLGTTTYIAAPPGTGKTELQKELLINLSCLHGWLHVIWSPETGSPEEIFAELCHAFIGKSYLKSKWQMSERERLDAEYFINEHFIIIDIDDEEEDFTITDFYSLCDKIEIETGKKIHTTTIDPWNELDEHYIDSDLGREDKFISRSLKLVRRDAKKNNRHNFILTHVRDQGMVSEGGISYYPFPHAREIAGGQTWFRKGMTVILMWRPPFGLSDSNHRAYGENELQIRIGKVKPKGTSKRGTYILNLDTHKYQYYILTDANQKIYADRGQHSFNQYDDVKPLPKPLTPNKHFQDLDKEIEQLGIDYKPTKFID
jgi:hypothetical protein